MEDNNEQKPIIEFRKDIVSGDWILVSSGRKIKPDFFKKKKLIDKDIKNCPFENPQKSGNSESVLWKPRPGKNISESFDDWFVQVIPNKYPLISRGNACALSDNDGAYSKIKAFGYHEIIITRDHDRPIHKMSLEEIDLLFETFQQRYLALEKDPCIEYIFIFHNQGPLAGATVPHPHSQLLALPIIPPDISRSINGAIKYFEENKKCVHCVMLEEELKQNSRIIYRNEHFVALTPYASRVPYEVRIFPLKHSSDFEEMPAEQRKFFAEAMKDALTRLNKVLKNPAYNFFIHTITSRVKNVPYYHWHIEILPHLYKWAGVELGTGVEVVIVSPEEAAENLRNIKLTSLNPSLPRRGERGGESI